MLSEKALSWCRTLIVILRNRRRRSWKARRSSLKDSHVRCKELWVTVLRFFSVPLTHAGKTLSALDKASFYGDHHRVGAVVRVQLRKDAAHVSLDRILRNFEMVGDNFVGAALTDHAQYLDF